MSFVDEELFDAYKELVKIIKPSISIEVGAFDADFSTYIAEDDICRKIYAFEASFNVYERFKKTLSSKIEYVNAAISSYSGTCDFYVQSNYDPGFVGSNSIKIKNDNEPTKKINVQCYSLDDFFLNKIDNNEKIVLWIDAEGAGDSVLKGCERILEAGLVYSIFIETEHQNFWKDSWLHDEINSYLSSKGMYLKKAKFQYINQTNCIYEKK